MAVKHLSKSEFDQAVNAGEDLVVVDFFATWCGLFVCLFVCLWSQCSLWVSHSLSQIFPNTH